MELQSKRSSIDRVARMEKIEVRCGLDIIDWKSKEGVYLGV
jgi:hypothetical protein